MPDDLAFLDATACAALVTAGDVSPGEMVEAAINRIEKVDPEISALVHARFDRARAEAAGAARRAVSGRAPRHQGPRRVVRR